MEIEWGAKSMWHYTDEITLKSPQQIIDFSIDALSGLQMKIEDLNYNGSDLYFIKINYMQIQISKKSRLKQGLILNYLIF